jgi:hypothetical protein
VPAPPMPPPSRSPPPSRRRVRSAARCAGPCACCRVQRGGRCCKRRPQVQPFGRRRCRPARSVGMRTVATRMQRMRKVQHATCRSTAPQRNVRQTACGPNRVSGTPCRVPRITTEYRSTARASVARAVDSFSVGTYTYSCATDCAGTTCEIIQKNKYFGGTLPDVFDTLSCASKITLMYRSPALWTSRHMHRCKPKNTHTRAHTTHKHTQMLRKSLY